MSSDGDEHGPKKGDSTRVPSDVKFDDFAHVSFSYPAKKYYQPHKIRRVSCLKTMMLRDVVKFFFAHRDDSGSWICMHGDKRADQLMLGGVTKKVCFRLKS